MSVGEVADWASIAALVVSGINTLLIFALRRRILLNVTLEPLLDRLRENSNRMNGCLLLFDASIDTFDEVIAICEANVRALRRRLGLRRSWFCRDLIKAFGAYGDNRSYDAARRVFNHLQRVVQEVANRVEERRITAS